MATIALPRSYAQMPHALICDRRLSDGAVRLWGMLHKCGWHREDVDTSGLAQSLGVTDRTIYRWLNELVNTGWISWEKQPGERGLGRRISLFETPKPLILVSEGVGGCDTTITPSDPGVTPSDTTITPSDPGVTPRGIFERSDAPKNETQILTQDLTQDPPPDPGGVGETADQEPHTDTESFLLDKGFSPSSARAFRQIALEAVQADYAKRTQEGAGIGAMVAAWRACPPRLTAAAPAKRPSDVGILTARISAAERKEWYDRFHANPDHQAQRQVLEQFLVAYPTGGMP